MASPPPTEDSDPALFRRWETPSLPHPVTHTPRTTASDGNTDKGSLQITVSNLASLTAAEASSPHPRDNKRVILVVFLVFFTVGLWVNYDNGAIAAVLPSIAEEFTLDGYEQGWIGALPFLGLAVGSLIASRLLQYRRQKLILTISLGLNSLSCLMLAMSGIGGVGGDDGPGAKIGTREDAARLLYASRFLIGVTQACYIIYATVWIEEFSPLRMVTLWQGLNQATAVFGVALGYVLVEAVVSSGLNWRWSIGIQSFFLFTMTAILIPIKHIYINLPDASQQPLTGKDRRRSDATDDDDTVFMSREDLDAAAAAAMDGAAVNEQPAPPSSLPQPAPEPLPALASPTSPTSPIPPTTHTIHQAATPEETPTPSTPPSSHHQRGWLWPMAQGMQRSQTHLGGEAAGAATEELEHCAIRRARTDSPGAHPIPKASRSRSLDMTPTPSGSGSEPGSFDVILGGHPLRRTFLEASMEQSSAQQSTPSSSSSQAETKGGAIEGGRGGGAGGEGIGGIGEWTPPIPSGFFVASPCNSVYTELRLAASVNSPSSFGRVDRLPLLSATSPLATTTSRKPPTPTLPSLPEDPQLSAVSVSVSEPDLPTQEVATSATLTLPDDTHKTPPWVHRSPDPMLVQPTVTQGTAASASDEECARRSDSVTPLSGGTPCEVVERGSSCPQLSNGVLDDGAMSLGREPPSDDRKADQQSDSETSMVYAGLRIQESTSNLYDFAAAMMSPRLPTDTEPPPRMPTDLERSGSGGEQRQRDVMASPFDLATPRIGFRQQVWILLRTGLYVSTVGAKCALFIVVTGIQYWAKVYFLEYYTMSEWTFTATFSAVVLTAPTLGVVLGGVLVDRLGGYATTYGTVRALVACTVSGILAAICSLSAGFMPSFGGAIALIWCLLVLGGAIIPTITGIIIQSVPPYLRPCAASISMFVYNVVGYPLGSLLPGVIRDEAGLRVGVQVVLSIAIVGVAFLTSSTLIALNKHRAAVREAELEKLRQQRKATKRAQRKQRRDARAAGREQTSCLVDSERHGCPPTSNPTVVSPTDV
ncbi:unnamed protein product [Vitrella brassicaformis CCMP3155]|uniref:Major facilitator superfamily (MFS) profile domain-containing protein n=3 Tax=Vitrella brassicaformis TaxID=1169539 RepID=A0A0G4GRR5_VITBC|nr:unnamed protein product [Vitrella brassicaformis CCMP3155]|eukprot:CEM33230.1 unnamed protein product [Vitrella brassicaformis CCMP3155]